jgi:hypothetical protein
MNMGLPLSVCLPSSRIPLPALPGKRGGGGMTMGLPLSVCLLASRIPLPALPGSWLPASPSLPSPASGEVLAVVRELERDRDVVGFAKLLDRRLEEVLAAAGNPQLVSLDAHLELRADRAHPLLKIAREIV